jgi:hypothetical protein
MYGIPEYPGGKFFGLLRKRTDTRKAKMKTITIVKSMIFFSI